MTEPVSGSQRYKPGFVDQSARAQHYCNVPADWHKGELWRCDEGHLWVTGPACEFCHVHGGRLHRGLHSFGLAWWPASFWQRLSWGGRRAHLDMAGPNRTQLMLKPPRGPGAVSRPPEVCD